MKRASRFSLFIIFIHCFLFITIGTITSAQAQTGEPQIVRKAGGVLAGSATKRVEPAYPPLAKAAQVSGAVVVEVTVDTEGKVMAARAISGHPLLKDAAITAARQWVFVPTKLSGQAVKVIGTITFNFNGDFKRDDSEELKAAKEAVRLNPNSVEAQYELGIAYSQFGRFEEAIEPFKKAISLKPDYEEAYGALGNLYDQIKRYDDAIINYRQGLEKLPESIRLLSGLSQIFLTTKRYDESLEILKKMVALEPAKATHHYQLARLYFIIKKDNEALTHLLQAINLEPKHTLSHNLLGAVYYRRGQYAEAINSYKQALASSPDGQLRGAIYVDLGVAYFKANQFVEAIEALKEGINLTSRRIDAYCHLGDAYAVLSRYEEALDAYKEGLEFYPGDAVFQNRIAGMYRKLGRAEDAEKFLREEIKNTPDAPGAYFDLAKLLYDNQSFEEGNSFIKKIVTIHSQNADVRIAAARLYSAYGRTAEAEAEYRAVLRFAPNNALVLNNLGYDLVERNEKLDEALKLIQRAVELEPRNGYYLDSLGWAYFKLGKLEDAERNLKQAADILPDAAEIYDHLGDVYQKQGRIEQAKTAWRRALSLSATSEDRTRLKAKIDNRVEKKN